MICFIKLNKKMFLNKESCDEYQNSKSSISVMYYA